MKLNIIFYLLQPHNFHQDNLLRKSVEGFSLPCYLFACEPEQIKAFVGGVVPSQLEPPSRHLSFSPGTRVFSRLAGSVGSASTTADRRHPLIQLFIVPGSAAAAFLPALISSFRR